MVRWLGYPGAGPLLAGAVGICACVLQSAVFGTPIPTVHDEFSYLLAADTFAHGRCTNPTHPLWQHFETIHVLQRPTYASKYPPGQGLFLAAGRVAFGHPVVGVWLGMGLACAAATWMLRAFLPRNWALAGGLIMATRLGFSEWGWCYMGGGVAAAAGALFVGGWARCWHRPRRLAAIVMAVGLSLLAISRPFEGLLLCVPVALATAVRFSRRHPPLGELVRQVLVPAAVVLVPAGAALGYYNYRVTGSAFRLPYMEHAAQYDAAPVLLIQQPYPLPYYRHDALRQFHIDFEFGDYLRGRTLQGWLERARGKVEMFWDMYLGYALTLSLLALPWVLRQSRSARFALLSSLFVLGTVVTTETWGLPHYVAPAAALLYLVVVQCFRRMALASPWMRWPVAVWLAVCLLTPAFSLASRVWESQFDRITDRLPDYLTRDLGKWLLHREPPQWALARTMLEQELKAAGGRHLVIVRYMPGHSEHEEWVYNDADIDAAAVVWAREMGMAGQGRLRNYFKDRTIWLVEVGPDGWGRSKLQEPRSSGRSGR
jgi:hypothetical protein